MFRKYRHNYRRKHPRKLGHSEIQKLFGNSYEHYIAELMRADCWDVFERNSLGYEDQGLDLTASRGGAVCYVQCKAYGHDKFLHENIIDQLYGAAAYQIGPAQMAGADIRLYTSGIMTEAAIKHAEKLDVQVLSVPIPDDWVRDTYYATDLNGLTKKVAQIDPSDFKAH